VKFLGKEGASLTTADDSQWTALMSAASAGHAGVVSFLLEQTKKSYPEYVNAATSEGRTALFYAARYIYIFIEREGKRECDLHKHSLFPSAKACTGRHIFLLDLCLSDY
tara:strand:+ start:221 stop:547 length:327 start_codon:yes stop_codon:yes gene_type:complete